MDSTKPSILIIDDEPGLRFMLRNYLEDSGLEVLEADNGLAGLQLFREQHPDMVISDLRMPEMDGLEVLSAVATEKPETPVVVISGAGLIQDVIEALRRGAWDYVVKPISDMGLILHVINKALERSHLLKLQKDYHRKLEQDVRQRTEELKKSRESYREQCEILNTLLQNIPMGIYYMNMEGVFLNINDPLARILGIAKENLVGKNFKNIPSLVPIDFLSIKAPENSQDFQVFRMQRPEGPVDLALQKVPVPGKNGQPLGVVALVKDVTETLAASREAKKREQQLIQADKMISLGILTAGVAHEINNPNHLIMLSTPLIAEAWQGACPILDDYSAENGDFLLGGVPYSVMRDKLPDVVKTIEEGSERIKEIVHEMKDFSRLDTDDAQKPIDLNKVLKASLKLVNNKLVKSCHNLSVELAENLPPILANHRQLEQVIINLLLNSAEALADETKAINVSTFVDTEKNMVTLSVQDQGVGIQENDMHHIFDPFFTTKRETGGTGLGLSISQKIIKKHGGEILFHSAPGQGTTALLLLPPA
ncbi:MAG: response regulator [Deltaproteobacteria bacterium]|nr:response regulator [Deltaproteobacteria bacterium]